MKGLLLFDFIHKNETINADHYIQTLQKLAICRKRVGMLTRGVKLLHDNATPHTAGKTCETIEKMCWEILEHPPHSPDLTPSDFHLFGKLKELLSGKRFASDQEVENETKLAYQLGRKFLCRRYFEISVTQGQMFELVWRLCGEIS
jgi:histone-lysine N-methyltransferase SETMAR